MSVVPFHFENWREITIASQFPWPSNVTGLERIALSTQGDLQRVLSAFFARPITIALVYSNTTRHTASNPTPVPLTLPNPDAIAATSSASPITQTRQVHLQCSGKIVCTATSTVRITSPNCAHLFLEEKYAIGQMFSRMEKIPAFELMAVGVGPVNETSQKALSVGSMFNSGQHHQLWRKYKLFVPDFECEILEVFPSRDMFLGGERWLDGNHWSKELSAKEINIPTGVPRLQAVLTLFPGLAFLLMLAFELSKFFAGRSLLC